MFSALTSQQLRCLSSQVRPEVPARETLAGVQPEDGAVVLQALSDDQRPESHTNTVREYASAHPTVRHLLSVILIWFPSLTWLDPLS